MGLTSEKGCAIIPCLLAPDSQRKTEKPAVAFNRGDAQRGDRREGVDSQFERADEPSASKHTSRQLIRRDMLSSLDRQRISPKPWRATQEASVPSERFPVTRPVTDCKGLGWTAGCVADEEGL